MRLVLLRHGQTTSNVAGLLDTGHPGASLTALGWAQAEAAARVLRERDVPLEAMFTSTLVRTQETGKPYAALAGLQPVVNAGLCEVSAADLEMKSDQESVHVYRHVIASWIRGDLDERMPGGESGHEFLRRYDGPVRAAAEHETALIVSHGAAIRAWVGARTDVSDLGHVPTESLHNTGCIEVEGDPDSGWRLLSWHNDPFGGHDLESEVASDPTGDDMSKDA